MGDHLESRCLRLPHSRQVTKIPTLNVCSLRRISLRGNSGRFAGPKLRDQGGHVTPLPQKLALGVDYTNVHAVKIFELARLPIGGGYLHAALPLQYLAQRGAEIAVLGRDLCQGCVHHIRRRD